MNYFLFFVSVCVCFVPTLMQNADWLYKLYKYLIPISHLKNEAYENVNRVPRNFEHVDILLPKSIFNRQRNICIPCCFLSFEEWAAVALIVTKFPPSEISLASLPKRVPSEIIIISGGGAFTYKCCRRSPPAIWSLLSPIDWYAIASFVCYFCKNGGGGPWAKYPVVVVFCMQLGMFYEWSVSSLCYLPFFFFLCQPFLHVILTHTSSTITRSTGIRLLAESGPCSICTIVDHQMVDGRRLAAVVVVVAGDTRSFWIESDEETTTTTHTGCELPLRSQLRTIIIVILFARGGAGRWIGIEADRTEGSFEWINRFKDGIMHHNRSMQQVGRHTTTTIYVRAGQFAAASTSKGKSCQAVE